jgi:hypothetical protein
MVLVVFWGKDMSSEIDKMRNGAFRNMVALILETILIIACHLYPRCTVGARRSLTTTYR